MTDDVGRKVAANLGIEDPTRSDSAPLTMADLLRLDAKVALARLEGRAQVMRDLDALEHRTEPHPSTKAAERDALEAALRLSDAMLERSIGVAPGEIRRLAEAELTAADNPPQDTAQPPVSPAVAAGITQPLKAPVGPRRPIDDAQWEGDQIRPQVHATLEYSIRYELEPCPRWMSANTYRWLIRRLEQGMKESPQTPLDHLHIWAARHVWRVFTPPKLTSSSGPYDLIGPALDFVRQAKRAGLTNYELAHGGRRRLLR